MNSDKMLQQFMVQLLARTNKQTSLSFNPSPGTNRYPSTSAGRSGFRYNYSSKVDEATACLAIDAGTEEQNKQLFKQLRDEKTTIEREFGGALVWDSEPGQRRCHIYYAIRDQGDYAHPETWNDLHDKMIDAMIRLDKVLTPRIMKLRM